MTEVSLQRRFRRARLGVLLGPAGYAVDLCRVGRFSFVNSHSYTKYLGIVRLQKQTGARVFVEAGTYFGVMALRCSRVFDRVITIEIDRDLAEYASRMLKGRDNIELVRGNAVVCLQSLLERPDVDDVVVYLDAHYSGQGTGQGDEPEPAIRELEILARFQSKIRAVVIDDFRDFGQEGYPGKGDLVGAAERCFCAKGFTVGVRLDQLVVARTSLGE